MARPAPLTARINPGTVRQLDTVAAAKGTTRSELVRQGIELILARPDASEILARAAVEGMMLAGIELARHHEGPLPAPRPHEPGTLAAAIASAADDLDAPAPKPLRRRAQRRKAPH